MPAFLYAPVRKGQTVGKLTYEINGKVLASVDLLAGEDLRPRSNRKACGNGFWIGSGKNAVRHEETGRTLSRFLISPNNSTAARLA